MTIWRVGMLAVYIGPQEDGFPHIGTSGLKVRGIYRVVGIEFSPVYPYPGLVIEGEGDWPIASTSFRPLNDAEDDAELIAKIKSCKSIRIPVEA